MNTQFIDLNLCIGILYRHLAQLFHEHFAEKQQPDECCTNQHDNQPYICLFVTHT